MHKKTELIFFSLLSLYGVAHCMDEAPSKQLFPSTEVFALTLSLPCCNFQSVVNLGKTNKSWNAGIRPESLPVPDSIIKNLDFIALTKAMVLCSKNNPTRARYLFTHTRWNYQVRVISLVTKLEKEYPVRDEFIEVYENKSLVFDLTKIDVFELRDNFIKTSISGDIISLFLIQGMDINTILDDCGNTLLHLLAGNPKGLPLQIPIIRPDKFLTNPQLKVNLRNSNGKTALHIFARTKSLNLSTSMDFIDLLLTRADINVNLQDTNGNTPTHIAFMKGHDYTIAQILESSKNYNMFIPNKKGKCPMQYAHENKYWLSSSSSEEEEGKKPVNCRNKGSSKSRKCIIS